jgi:phosphohistidine swiveling domain-containing protein
MYILELGKIMVKEGRILHEEDVFFLHIKELQAMCNDSKNYIDLMNKRKNTFKAFRNFDAPNEFGRGIIADTKTKASVVDGKRTFTGVGCSAGVYEGVARVIFSPQDITLIKDGEILITKFTDPGWTPVLGAVQAVVTEVGGVLSHAAVIGREYGIPAVLNINKITSLVQTGMIIKVDGDAGTVTIIKEANL